MTKISSFDENLFLMVTTCGILGAFIPVLVKMVLQIITSETDMEASLRRQMCDLKAELGSISMVEEFAKYAKIQRKVNKVTDELKNQSQIRSLFTWKVRLIATGTLYAFMSTAVAILLWYYREIPVVVLPEKWLFPLASILSFPSGVPGGISLTSWLFVSSSVGRLLANSLPF